MGYGKRALQCLVNFFEGKSASLDENPKYIDENMVRVTDEELESATLQTDNIQVRDPKSLPPLLLRMSEKRPDSIDYLGVSYGLTANLHKFWKREGFIPVYLRQTATDLTGEHSCIMIRPVEGKESTWLGAFARDFHRRFLQLLSYNFREFSATLSLMIVESAQMGTRLDSTSTTILLTKAKLDEVLSPFDLKRLESYANNMLDYHVIIDIVPLIAQLYFSGVLRDVVLLSPVQQAILISIGLQRKSVDDLEKELNLPNQQVLAMFIKIIRKAANYFRSLLSESISATLPAENAGKRGGTMTSTDEMGSAFKPLDQSLQDDLDEAGKEAMTAYREKQKELINSIDLSKFEIPTAGNWDEAERLVDKKGGKVTTVSVKTESHDKKRKATAAEIYEQEFGTLDRGKGKKGKRGKR